MFSFCRPASPMMESMCIHTWTIEHFDCCDVGIKALNRKEYIESKIFKPKNSELEFFLRLYPFGTQPDNKDHVSVALCLKPGRVDNVKLKVSFVIDNIRNEAGRFVGKSIKKTAIHNFYQKDQFVCKQFIPLEELDHYIRHLKESNSLIIYCEIEEVGNLEEESWKNEEIDEFSSSCTQVGGVLMHAWTIKDIIPYLKGGKMDKNSMYSPDFSTRDGKTVFFLSLLPNGNPENHLSVYLHLKNENCDTKFNFGFFMILGDANETKRNIRVIKNQKLSTKGWGFLKYISFDELMNSANNYLINEKHLRICVTIEDVENKLIQGSEPAESE